MSYTSPDVTITYQHKDTISVIKLDETERYFVTGARDGGVVFWNINSFGRINVQQKIYDFDTEILAAYITYDSYIAAIASLKGKINIYNLVNNKLMRTIFHPRELPIHKVGLSLYPFGSVAFFSEVDKHLYVFTINGQIIWKKEVACSKILDMVIANDNNFLDVLVSVPYF